MDGKAGPHLAIVLIIMGTESLLEVAAMNACAASTVTSRRGASHVPTDGFLLKQGLCATGQIAGVGFASQVPIEGLWTQPIPAPSFLSVFTLTLATAETTGALACLRAFGRGLSHVPTDGIVLYDSTCVFVSTFSFFTTGGHCTSQVPTDGLSLNVAAAVLAAATVGAALPCTLVLRVGGILFNHVPTDGFSCGGILPIVIAGVAFGIAGFRMAAGNLE
mmetsp:Transcript_20467/g.57592  ORF Transcript_20467/g.57592 Transcript_20467/m.57592 type:complete len:219 (+) Transcript_20467:209-865(+)